MINPFGSNASSANSNNKCRPDSSFLESQTTSEITNLDANKLIEAKVPKTRSSVPYNQNSGSLLSKPTYSERSSKYKDNKY